MSFTPHDSIDKTNLLMDLISQKQKVLGSNLANVNTPGYNRQDLDFSQVLGSMNSPLETKLSQKMGSSPAVKTSGGEVNPAVELIEIQKNALYYTIATRRVSSVIQELKTIAQLGR